MFLLGFKQIRLAADRMQKYSLPASMGMTVILYEACLDKGDASLDDFEESLLPPDFDLVKGFYDALQEHCSVAANERYRPTKASEKSTGSNSSASGESDSGNQ